MTARRAAACALGALLAALTSAGPALAQAHVPEEVGTDVGNGMTLAEGLVVFLLAPGAVVALITTLVLLPGIMNSNRYRPARGWDAPPMWFAGPADPERALEGAQPVEGAKGGARGDW